MPDLDIVGTWTCATNTFWEHEVESHRGGAKYTVRFEPRPWPHEVQYDYTCTCKAFKFGRGSYCKHIEEVKHLRCGWNYELDVCAEIEEDDGGNVCPECGGPVEAMRVGV